MANVQAFRASMAMCKRFDRVVTEVTSIYTGSRKAHHRAKHPHHESHSSYQSSKHHRSTDMAADKSSILVVGGTGYLGRRVVAASARLGHPTLALVRDTAPSDPAKAELLKSFEDAGVTLVKGDLYDHGSLVRAAKLADVVISTVRPPQLADQTRLLDAIKEAGNVKRFLPSEFGFDVDRSDAVEPTRSVFVAAPSRPRACPTRTCGPATSSATGCRASGRSWPSHRPPSTRPSSSATATPRCCSWTRGTSRRTRCWRPTTRARRTRRCTSGRRPTRCRRTSCWRSGRARPEGRSSGCTSPRTPSSSRSKRLRFR
ncbi:hypothetical protein BS78_03G094000 [Paspalum vaginatum]|nr:hypothetical protein BS78_03G094000 [Paspalum vaginatum]